MLLPFTLLFFFFFFLMLFPLDHAMLASDEQRYSNCSKRLKRCGEFDITYPFWEFRPEEYYLCGHPGYGVVCKDGNLSLEIGDDFYQVLNISKENQSLIIVREDILHNICTEPRNSFDLDPPYFSLTDNDTDATLLFNCSSLPPQQLYQLDCIYSHDHYWLTNLTTRDDDFFNSNCPDNLKIPMLKSAARQLADNRIDAADALEKGFQVKWTLDDVQCLACFNSLGVCGYNTSLSKFSCFCTDGPHNGTCSGPLQHLPEKPRWPVKLGIAVGAVGGTAIVMSLVFFFITRYRRNQKPTSYVVSRSVSSHYSSRMDCERGGEYYGLPIFEYDELRSATNNFDPEKELGDGGFGTVFHGKLKDGRVVAVKRLYEHNYKRTEQFINEVEILARLHHPNLVRLYGCTSRMSNRLLLVYEYVPNGTVADHLHGDLAKPGSLPWSIRINIAIETASALVYLHASEIIHRDVKTNNILLDENFKVKVADFGLSRLFPLNATHVSTAPQGTPGYVDPEYHECYQLTEKSDVYSFGVVLMELISSLPAVDIMRHRHEINLSTMAINKIQNDAIHELVDKNLGFGLDYDVTRMIMAVAELGFLCLQNGKDMRPSMAEVLEVLQNIQKEDTGADKIKDVHSDVVALLKVDTSSPVSVASKWVSSENTTPNSSG